MTKHEGAKNTKFTKSLEVKRNMRKIDLRKLSKADLKRLGAAAVTYENTRPLTARDRGELGRAAR